MLAICAVYAIAYTSNVQKHLPGKSPMKLEVTSRHDHSCLLGRKASKQTNKQTETPNIHEILLLASL